MRFRLIFQSEGYPAVQGEFVLQYFPKKKVTFSHHHMKYYPLARLYLWLLCYLLCSKGMAQNATAIPADSALSVNVIPNRPPGYYTEQGVMYFRTMQTGVPVRVRPDYAARVIRWEWHPWLLLTGYKRANLINIDMLLKLYKTGYDTVDCRYFDKEPFCRCHVMFNYSGWRIPIYEEFTFNTQGEITFIEAWSDYPSLIPMDKKDYWAQRPGVKRLSTRVPGLGSNNGLIKPNAGWMKNAALTDTSLADLLRRIKHPLIWYTRELYKQKTAIQNAGKVPEGDVYPYF